VVDGMPSTLPECIPDRVPGITYPIWTAR
jgi:hypothetical protein